MTALRALVIGAGPAAHALHLPVLARLRERGLLILDYLCDLHTDRVRAAATQFGFREYGGDAREALGRRDIDVVYLLGSAQMHHQLGLAVLEAGKHLFVEKPIAPSYREAMELVSAAREGSRVAVGGHNRRFYRAIDEVRRRAGRGGWSSGEAIFHKPEFGKAPPFGARSWLSANGIHALDALLYVMGSPPDHLFSTACTLRGGMSQNFSAVLRWNDGRHATFLCNNEAGLRCERYTFHGAGETFVIGQDESVLETPQGRQRWALPLAEDGFEAEHEAFLASVNAGRPPPHALDTLAPALFVAELIEQGHTGAVKLAGTQTRAGTGRPARPSLQSVLVAGCDGLLPALARRPHGFRLVTLKDVEDSGGQRADVVGALLGRTAGPLSEALLDRLPRLAIVGIAGLSVARFGPERLLARDIVLANAAAAYADSVAELVLAFAILGRRRGFASHEVMRRGGWGSSLAQVSTAGRLLQGLSHIRPALRALQLEGPLLRAWRQRRPTWATAAAAEGLPGTLRDAEVGLVGWGASARRVAHLLRPLGARVCAWSEHASDAELQEAGVVRASLARAFAADIVSLHRGLTRDTHHGIGPAELARLRPGATLINVARGALIQPDALLARLRRGDVQACLDSFEEEPLPASHALRRLRNVFLTAHIGGGSRDMHEAAAEEVVGKVLDFLKGETIEPLSAARVRRMS